MTGRIARNSAWSASGYLGGALVLLLATPLYVHYLGAERFGLFSLLVAVTAPLGILNAGLAQATTKYVAQFSRCGMWRSAARMIETTLAFNLAWGLCGAALLWFGAPWIGTAVFHIRPDMLTEAAWAFRLSGINWLLTQVLGTYQAAITGLQDFKRLTLVQLVQQALAYGVGSLVIVFVPRIWGALLPQVVISALLIGFWFGQVRKHIPQVRCAPRWHHDSARLSIGFSAWQVVNSITATASEQADRLTLGSMVDTAAVGYYSVGATVQARLVGLVWSMFAAVFPAVSSLSGAAGESERLILDYGWKVSVFAGCLYATLFVLGPDFLQMWLGHDVGGHAAPILRVLAGVALAGLPSAILAQYLLGHGLTKWSTLSNVFTSALSVTLTVVFVKQSGIRGAAWGALLALLLTRPLFHLWVFGRRFRDSVPVARCFWGLYSILVSASVGCGIGVGAYRMLGAVLPAFPAFVASAVVVPFIVLAVTTLIEASLMGHRQQVEDLWSDLGRGVALVAAKMN